MRRQQDNSQKRCWLPDETIFLDSTQKTNRQPEWSEQNSGGRRRPGRDPSPPKNEWNDERGRNPEGNRRKTSPKRTTGDKNSSLPKRNANGAPNFVRLQMERLPCLDSEASEMENDEIFSPVDREANFQNMFSNNCVRKQQGGNYPATWLKDDTELMELNKMAQCLESQREPMNQLATTGRLGAERSQSPSRRVAPPQSAKPPTLLHGSQGAKFLQQYCGGQNMASPQHAHGGQTMALPQRPHTGSPMGHAQQMYVGQPMTHTQQSHKGLVTGNLQHTHREPGISLQHTCREPPVNHSQHFREGQRAMSPQLPVEDPDLMAFQYSQREPMMMHSHHLHDGQRAMPPQQPVDEPELVPLHFSQRDHMMTHSRPCSRGAGMAPSDRPSSRGADVKPPEMFPGRGAGMMPPDRPSSRGADAKPPEAFPGKEARSFAGYRQMVPGFERADILPQSQGNQARNDGRDKTEVQMALKHLTNVTPCINMRGISDDFDFLTACDPAKKGKKVTIREIPKKPNLNSEQIRTLVDCETADICREKVVRAETMTALKKPCPKQQAAKAFVRQMVHSKDRNQDFCVDRNYPPMVDPDPEDLSPELAAAIMFSQEQGIRLEDCPEATINYLFPDPQKKSKSEEKPPQDNFSTADMNAEAAMIRKSESVPAEGVSDSAYSATMRDKGNSRQSYDLDNILGPENREYVLVSQKPQRLNKIQFRGCMTKFFPGYLSAFPDEVNLPKVVSSVSEVFGKAWAATRPKTYPAGDVVVVE